MERKYQGIAFTMVILLVCGQTVCADTELPNWEPGFQWSIQTHLDIHMKDPDSSDQIDMLIDDDAPDYVCEGMETRTLSKGEMRDYNVYRLKFSGNVTGEGTADVNLVDVEIPIELRNGTQVGETWVDTETLGTVYTTRFITGDLWAYYLFSWQQVGDIQLAFNEEYQPPRDAANFPIEVSNQWQDDMTIFFYGRYEINYDLGSGPQVKEDHFDDFKVFNLTYDVIAQEMYKTWLSYRTEGTDPLWDGMLRAYYSDVPINYAYMSMTNIDMPEQGLLIREITMDLIDFDLMPFPTPTPTPTPDPSSSGVTLNMNADVFEQGDTFRLSRTIVNAGSVIIVDEYIVLDVFGSYWFWPDWSETVASETKTLDAFSIYPDMVALTFVWPDGTGSAEGLRFWGALLDSSSQELFGSYDMVTWGFR